MLYNNEQAQAEGWVLSQRDDGFYEIQRYDDDPGSTFPDDDEALTYVKNRAKDGSLMHAEAAALHGQPWRAHLRR